MKISSSRAKGFGLIEILVVVSIIGILSGVGLTSTQSMRAKAKDSKVKTEVRSVNNALEVYSSTAGGTPNPFPSSTRRLYCVGSTECSFRGRAVNQKLNVDGLTLPEFGDGLTSYSNDFGTDQGYIYMSCADPDSSACLPEDTALIYATDDEEWLGWFNGNQPWNIDEDFDWDEQGIDWDDYDLYDEEEGDNGVYIYACSPTEYPIGSFEAYSFTEEAVVILSPYCVYDVGDMQYNCSNTCENSSYHFQTIVLYEAYPYAYFCQDLSACVDYQGQGYCTYICD